MTSQPGRFIKKLPKDSELLRVGSIFQKSPFKRLYVNVQFKGLPEQSVPVEILPMLRLGCRYDNKKVIPYRKSKSIRFKVTQQPELCAYPEGNFIVFNEQGKRISIPAFELANKLFFHSNHMAKLAFLPNALDYLATTEVGKEETYIRLSKLARYPLSNLKSRSACRHLAWMLLDKDARRSFQSVYQKIIECDSNEWNFGLELPPLTGWKIELHYEEDSDDSSLVHGLFITELNYQGFSHYNHIFIKHPDKKEPFPVQLDKSKKRSKVPPTDPDPEVNLDGEPNRNAGKDIVPDYHFRFKVGSADTSVTVDKGIQVLKVSPIVDPDKDFEKAGSGVGDESSTSGNMKELEWATNRQDDDLPIDDFESSPITSHFIQFEKVIDMLVEKDGYRLEDTKCLQMPPPSKGNKSAYVNRNTGKPRVFHVAYVRYKSRPVVIVEVDLSGLPDTHTLSTMLFILQKPAKESFIQIIQACSNEGVHWDSNVNQSCSVFRRRVKASKEDD